MTIKHRVLKFVIYDEKTFGSVRYYIICLKLYEKKEYLIKPSLVFYDDKTSGSVILITMRRRSALWTLGNVGSNRFDYDELQFIVSVYL